MKNKWNIIGLVVLIAVAATSPAYAKPERLPIKSAKKMDREKRAEALVKSVDLSKIADDQTRLALQAVFEVLNLKTADERLPKG